MEETRNYPNELDLPMEEKAQQTAKTPSQSPTPSQQVPAYKPTELTMQKLTALPWKEITSELGIRLEDLLKNTKHYGTLEALAYGRFTEPLGFYIQRGHEQPRREMGTIRLYTFKNAEGQTDWGYEIHPVKFRQKLDEAGNAIMKDGEPVVEIDRNPLVARYDDVTGLYVKDSEESLTYKKHPLTQEQVRHLRLTGNLGEPFTTVGFKGEQVKELLSVDPYNKHRLVAVRADAVRARYNARPEVVLKGGDTVTLTKDNVTAIADGLSVWAKSAKGKDCCLQYDSYEGKVRQVRSYEMCCREDVRKEVTNGQQKGQAQSQSVKQEPPQPRKFHRE